MNLDAKRQAEQRRIAAQLGEIGFALPGSLTVKAYRCGKQNCRCHGDPPRLHGPYAFWTRKVNNKTVTRMLNDEQLAAYQPMFDSARRIRALVAELQELSLELVDPGPANPRPKPAAAGRRPETSTNSAAPGATSPKPGRAASRPRRQG